MAIGSIGLLHPGEMGAAVGGELVRAGHRVIWASRGRRPPSRTRAEAAGLVDVETIDALVQASDAQLFRCARRMRPWMWPKGSRRSGASTLTPTPSRPLPRAQVADIVEHAGGEYVDGCVIGSPPTRDRATRLYLAGKGGPTVLDFFAGTSVQAAVVASDPVAASVLKMSYAAWSKGSAALLLAVRALAAAEGVLEPLLAAWQASELDLAPQPAGGRVGGQKGLALGRGDGRSGGYVPLGGTTRWLPPRRRRDVRPGLRRGRGASRRHPTAAVYRRLLGR